jgi:hypothetical protein
VRGFPGVSERITLSIGVAGWHAGESSAEWYARADAALYEAKRRGRSRLPWLTPCAIDWGPRSAAEPGTVSYSRWVTPSRPTRAPAPQAIVQGDAARPAARRDRFVHQRLLSGNHGMTGRDRAAEEALVLAAGSVEARIEAQPQLPDDRGVDQAAATVAVLRAGTVPVWVELREAAGDANIWRDAWHQACRERTHLATKTATATSTAQISSFRARTDDSAKFIIRK